MKANEVSLNDFLSQPKTQFVIPVYQRNYDWSEEQCKQLFFDILEVGSKSDATHFIGSIVFIHDGVFSVSEVKKLVIIDGQQRLTTFSLLYLALYKFAQEKGLLDKAEELKDIFLSNKYVKEETNKLKLKQSENNARAFKFLYSENNPVQYDQFSNVINNYNYFRQYISLSNYQTVLDGLERLLFVEISLERGKDDPQRIFESLNSTGLELSQSDLIRNYILMGLEPDTQNLVYENSWSVIEMNAKDYENEIGKVTDFIRDYLTYKSKKIPNRNAVYDEFKNRYKKRDQIFYGKNLEDLKTYSYHYNKLINPEKEIDIDIQRELKYINRLEMNVVYPFLMPVYNDFTNQVIDKNIFLSILKLLQSFVWRRYMLNIPTNRLNKIFLSLYSDIVPENYLPSLEAALVMKKGAGRFPTDTDIEKALLEKDLYNIQSKNTLYFLEKMENHENKEWVSFNNPNLTIEHIFPQNPDSEWQTSLDKESYDALKEKYLHTAANLTLSGNNGSLSNKSFLQKKLMNHKEKEQGYKFSNLKLNAFLKEIDNWDLITYQERNKWMLNRFKKIWEYPEVEIDVDDIDADEDYNIFDAPDPKHKKLDYFIFRDEKIETEEVSKMYYHVIVKLLNENPATFSHPDVGAIVQITSNPSTLRTPNRLNATYFIEANIDSNTKFSRLKKLLTRFNAEDDLIINFSNGEPGEAEILKDREFWESRSNPEGMRVMEEVGMLLQTIEANLKLNFVYSYIGIIENTIAQNFAIFYPKQSFIRAEILVSNPGEWNQILVSAGFKVVSIGKRSGRIKFRINGENLILHSALITDILQQSFREWKG
jgi:uncharacterized protein with ParB-like and HNH nuclease domain